MSNAQKPKSEVKQITALRNQLHHAVSIAKNKPSITLSTETARRVVEVVDFLLVSQCIAFNQMSEYDQKISNLAELIKDLTSAPKAR